MAHRVATVGWHTGWRCRHHGLLPGAPIRIDPPAQIPNRGDGGHDAFDVRDPRFADQHEYWLMVAHKVATVNNAQGIVDSSGAKVPKGDAVIMGYFLEHPSGSTHRRRYRIEEMEVTMDVRLMFHLDIGEELKELSNGVFEVPKTTDTMLQGLLGLV